MCLTSFPVFHTYGITFHTRAHPIFHTENLPYGIWNMDRKPDLDDLSSSASSSCSGHLGAVGRSIALRARLTSRSRTGCWTCRTRKVKCDEGRPVCGQCTRLRHNCDYSPRLTFRDDTLRVRECMRDVTIITSSVWDRQYCLFHIT
jgi:hypothetical protein